MKIAHIINPVKVSDKSDLFIAQPITFETMKNAKEFAKKNNIDVELFYTYYEEDSEIAPGGFEKTKFLEKSILDYGNFKTKRKLPLIKDILDRLYESSNADYFIYTNVDIALMPHFYNFIANVIKQGYDGFVINRRTISKKYSSIDEIPQMYSEIGEKHPGYDCFVFKRDVYPKYQLGTACIGANWIGRVIISNVIAHSNKFKVFEDEHLTFHIGDDRSWKIDKFNDYDKHNENVLISTLEKIFENPKAHTKPLLKQFYNHHAKKSVETTVVNCKGLRKDNPYYKLWYNKKSVLKQNPTFIVGFPRSGTTFLLNNLITQEAIFSLPETHFFDIVYHKIDLKNFDNVISHIERWVPLSDNAKEFIHYTIKKSILTEKIIFETIIIDYLLKQVDLNNISKVEWVEKTPDHCLYMDNIIEFYPEAKFIYILRNPIAAFNSWRRVAKGWGGEWKPVEEYAKMWKYRLEKALKFKSKYPNKLMFIKLENLRKNLNFELKKIFNFIQIPFQEELIGVKSEKSKNLFLEHETWKQEAISNKIQTSDKVSESDLTQFEIFRAYLILFPLLKRFNYDISFDESLFKSGIVSKEEIDKTLKYFENSFKENNFLLHNNIYQDILNELEKFTKISFRKNPILKYKAYKILMKRYNSLKG